MYIQHGRTKNTHFINYQRYRIHITVFDSGDQYDFQAFSVLHVLASNFKIPSTSRKKAVKKFTRTLKNSTARPAIITIYY
jgi:hypothetical protein